VSLPAVAWAFFNAHTDVEGLVTIHSSLYSPSTASIRRVIAYRFGKMATTSLRCQISRFSRSCGFVDQI